MKKTVKLAFDNGAGFRENGSVDAALVILHYSEYHKNDTPKYNRLNAATHESNKSLRTFFRAGFLFGDDRGMAHPPLAAMANPRRCIGCFSQNRLAAFDFFSEQFLIVIRRVHLKAN